jgi:hypothetical protein
MIAHAVPPQEDRHFGPIDPACGHAIDRREEIHEIGVQRWHFSPRNKSAHITAVRLFLATNGCLRARWKS